MLDNQSTFAGFSLVKRMVYATLLLSFSFAGAFGQEAQKAKLTLSFAVQDSLKVCKALVMAGDKPVNEIDVHFYIKRMFGLLPLGKGEKTDENGFASVNLPLDIPGDRSGNIQVIAKIEDDDTYGSVETAMSISNFPIPGNVDEWSDRSLSASRAKAPMYLIITSNLIIAGIWGVLAYIIFQIFRIRKNSEILNK